MINGSAYLYEYKSGDGTFTIDRIDDDLQGVTEQYTASQTPGFTTIEPFYLEGQPSNAWLFKYNSSGAATDPNAAIEAVTQPWATGISWQGSWKSNWTIVKPFYLGNRTYLFEYRPPLVTGDAVVAIDQLDGSGQGSTEVWRGQWSNGWTTIEPFYFQSGVYLLEHKRGDETVAIDHIRADAGGTDEVWRGEWQGLLTIVKVFYVNGHPYVFQFDGDRSFSLLRIRDDLQGFTFISEGTWAPNKIVANSWQTIEPFYKSGGVYFAACDYTKAIAPLPGQQTAVSFGKLNDDLSGISTVWSDTWSRGWTHLRPFYFPPSPFPPVAP